jgi:uncharacterized protein (UPF0248 family)
VERTLRELLNRLRWDAGRKPSALRLNILEREGPHETLRPVEFGDVTSVLPGGVELADGTFIPYHRIREVWQSGEMVWPRVLR